MPPSIALWGHPRSISTAVERSFTERGDYKVFHEAFAYVYFMHEQRRDIPHKHPDPGHPQSYDAVRAMLEDARQEGPVFHKDFAYHVVDHLLSDVAFLRGRTNTFIVRDPDEAVLSHATVHPGLSVDVLGYAELAQLFDVVADLTGSAPVVINARDLVAEPSATLAAYCDAVKVPFLPEALRWSRGSRPEWATWKGWHADVAESQGFAPPARRYQFGFGDRSDLRAFADHCRPFYDKLDRHSLKIIKETAR